MDPSGMAEVRDLIASLGTDGRTVLLSSHLLNEVEQVCESLAILSKGKLIAQGDVADLLRSKEQVRLRTNNDTKARQVLSALDWVEEVTTEDESLLVTAEIQRSADLTASLSRAEVYVTEMMPFRRSLEQYFFDVTGGDQDRPE